jgi:hypothetical protein
VKRKELLGADLSVRIPPLFISRDSAWFFSVPRVVAEKQKEQQDSAGRHKHASGSTAPFLTEEDIVCGVSEDFGCTSTGTPLTMPGNIQLQQVLSHSDA